MGQKIRILVVDDIEETRSLIGTLLSFEERFEIIGEASNGQEAIELSMKLKPDVILMDINMPGINGLKATEEIKLRSPEIIVIIMSIQKEHEYLKKAMLYGAREYIVKPFDLNTVVNTIIDAYDKEQDRKDFLKKINKDAEQKKKPKTFTVFSTKGGVGKTTIAVNTAISIAKQTGEKVAILDLDLQFGDVALMLNITPSKTIVDLVEEISNLDSDILGEYMIDYVEGVKVLAAPLKPEYAEYVSSSHIEKIIEVLKRDYQYVIIDTCTNLEDVTLTALDMADKIIFLSTMDLLSIKNVKLGLDVMNSLNYTDEKVKVVINKATQQFGIRYKDLKDVFEKDISALIPEDSKTIITSINKGYPFMRYRKNNKICRSLKEFSRKIADDVI